MYQPPPGFETVIETTSRGECLESRFVLDAVGIPAQTLHWEGRWFLVVPGTDLERSVAELDAYRRENREQSARSRVVVPVYRGSVLAVFVYSGLLILIAIQTAQGAYGLEWMSSGQMQAGKVMAGQWWRTVTALTLHLDLGHLASNLVFGAVFGLLAGRLLGGGVAWLAIVIAGALGNLTNAVVQSPTHTSIGASTAVFAALGVVVAHALGPLASSEEKPIKRWSPLIGGLVLLAFTGVGGERTDVAAHVTGFLAGLLIGWVGSRLPSKWLENGAVQTWTGASAITIVAAAWIVGLVVAG